MKILSFKYLIILTAFGITFLGYFILFPNDFFLSKAEFIKNNNYVHHHSFFRLTLYDIRKISPNVLKVIKNPDNYLLEKRSFLKDNHKRTVSELIVDSQKIIIKRFNNKNFYDWITKCPFRSSKAYRSWFYAHELNKSGIETVKPIAIIEKRWGPFWTETYLITEFVEGNTLDTIILKNNSNLNQKISSKITEILATFNQMKWLHRDFISQNIIIKENNLTVIDLDEMHSYAFNNYFFKKKFKKKHLEKFISNIPEPSSFSRTFLMTHNSKNTYNSSTINFDSL